MAFSAACLGALVYSPVVAAQGAAAPAQSITVGPSGLPLPRFVSLKSGARADPAQLLAACRQRLDDPVAAPVQLTILDQLPLTPVGKLDKVALRARAAADHNPD